MNAFRLIITFEKQISNKFQSVFFSLTDFWTSSEFWLNGSDRLHHTWGQSTFLPFAAVRGLMRQIEYTQRSTVKLNKKISLPNVRETGLNRHGT